MSHGGIAAVDPDRLSAAARRVRRRRFRLGGLVLMVYGLIGVSILGFGAVSIGQPLGQIGGLGGTLDEQRAALLRALETTTTTIEGASGSVTNLGSSLGQARTSTDRAAGIAREVSGTMGQLSQAMSLSIFGAQPLVGLVGPFQQASDQLGRLGTDLDGIGTALATNADDTRAMATNLDALRDNVEELTQLVEDTRGLGVSGSTVAAISVVLYALVGWLLVLAFGCVFAGLTLWRAAGPRL